MQCFVGGRRSGKTSYLINLSHDTGYPIVTRSKAMADYIESMAMRMGKVIPQPLTYGSREMLLGSPLRRSVLVDEADGVLSDMMGVQIVACALNGNAVCSAETHIASMGLFDLLKVWRKARKTKHDD